VHAGMAACGEGAVGATSLRDIFLAVTLGHFPAPVSRARHPVPRCHRVLANVGRHEIYY
jgi:hypothetical protein